MRFYKRQDDPSQRPVYFPTLGAAHEDGKKEEEVWRSSVRIREVELPSDKEAFLALLNEGTVKDEFNGEGRLFTVTARGGLKEIKTDAV